MTAPACRFCRAPLTQVFLDLGLQPLANAYLTPEQLAAGTETRMAKKRLRGLGMRLEPIAAFQQNPEADAADQSPTPG